MVESAEHKSRYGHPFGQPVTQAVVERLDAREVRLEGEDAHHLRKSLRLRVGESFVATDGEGTVARLELSEAGRDFLQATVRERVVLPRPRLRFWLVAEAEGARGDWLVEKAAELGAWAYLPLAGTEGGRLSRWERLARAALKQSLGAWRMRLPEPGAGPGDALRRTDLAGVWLADPSGQRPERQTPGAEGDWLLVSGPPGGLDEAAREAWLGRREATAVTLGSGRLRAETAALALLVLARAQLAPAEETA